MIYILFVGILILFFTSFFLFKKNILNPSVILCSVFLVSLFFSILNAKKWGVTFHLNTTLIILGTIIVFILGNSIVYLLPKKNKKIVNLEEKILINTPSFKLLILINIIFLILLYKYFQEIYKLSLIGGNPGGYNLMLFYARNAKLNFYNEGRFLTFGVYFGKSVSYICFFIFSYLTIFEKFKIKNLFLLFPTIIYCGFIILSTGRTEFIYLLVYMLVVFFILYQQKYKFNQKITKKIIVYGILSLLIFFVIFSLAGLLTGKTQTRSIFEMISIYAGTSIPSLDIYLNSPKVSNTYFGENTFFGIYNVLRKFGYKIQLLYVPYEFVYFGGIMTNIYTAIRRYYEDFGIEGLFLITFLLGLFYGIFFYYASYKKNNFFILILYANFCFPIFEFPIEERFFMILFPTAFIYNFIFLGIVYYFLVYKNIKKKELKLYKEYIK